MYRCHRVHAYSALEMGLCLLAAVGPFHEAQAQQLSPRPCAQMAAPIGIDTLVMRCGNVTVPQSRDRSDRLAPVELPVAIFSRRDTPEAATPLLYLAGGPGNSAIDEVVNSFLASPTGRAVIRQRPIIAFD